MRAVHQRLHLLSACEHVQPLLLHSEQCLHLLSACEHVQPLLLHSQQCSHLLSECEHDSHLTAAKQPACSIPWHKCKVSGKESSCSLNKVLIITRRMQLSVLDGGAGGQAMDGHRWIMNNSRLSFIGGQPPGDSIDVAAESHWLQLKERKWALW